MFLTSLYCRAISQTHSPRDAQNGKDVSVAKTDRGTYIGKTTSQALIIRFFYLFLLKYDIWIICLRFSSAIALMPLICSIFVFCIVSSLFRVHWWSTSSSFTRTQKNIREKPRTNPKWFFLVASQVELRGLIGDSLWFSRVYIVQFWWVFGYLARAHHRRHHTKTDTHPNVI